MALSHSTAESNRNAARDLAAKLRLEAQFKPQLRGFFGDIARDFKAVFSATGRIISVNEYRPELISLLKSHYRKVRNQFGMGLRVELVKVHSINLDFKAREGDVADTEQSQYIRDRAEGQSKYIMDTTQSELEKAVALEVALAISRGVDESTTVVAAKAAERFLVKQEPRVVSIATSETNNSAEGLKWTEASSLSAAGVVIEEVPMRDALNKEWSSILDEVTRLNHAIADGQVRGLYELFDVGGQKLMVPGDDSHGATLDNIINCRCSSQYTIKKRTVF